MPLSERTKPQPEKFMSREREAAYRVLQSLLLLPLILLWLSQAGTIALHSDVLMTLFFPSPTLAFIALIVLPIIAIVLSIVRLILTPRATMQIWGLNIGLCLFIALSLMMVFDRVMG
jgi:hypothetical protein